MQIANGKFFDNPRIIFKSNDAFSWRINNVFVSDSKPDGGKNFDITRLGENISRAEGLKPSTLSKLIPFALFLVYVSYRNSDHRLCLPVILQKCS